MNFKMAAMAATLDIGTERFLAILNLHVATMPPTVSTQSDLRFWRRYRKCEKLTTDGRSDDGQQATAKADLEPGELKRLT